MNKLSFFLFFFEAEIKKKKTDSDEAEVQDGESEWHSPEQKNK